MSYSDLKKTALRKRKQAIKKNIPSQYLAMADAKIDKAIFSREDPTGKNVDAHRKRLGYARGVSELLVAIDIFDAHLLDRFSGLPLKFISKLVA